jgi:lysophospholipase L1-like esterase
LGIRGKLGVVASNLFIFLGALALLEVGFRFAAEGYSDHAPFRATQPPPYRNAPYFSQEFIAESFRQPGGWRPLSGTNTIVPNDFRGTHFTVEQGVRRTTDVPHDATATVYLFGGSTVYGSEVPDSHTIASYLQRGLTRAGFRYRVVNFGVTSINTRQQLERLELTTLAEGDVVIFYDGVNDVLQGVLYGNAGETIVGNDRSRPLTHKVLYRLSKNSVAARHLLTQFNANYKIADLPRRVASTEARYESNLAAAEQLARANGAAFMHFLQPTLYSLAKRGDYENKLLTFGFVPVQAEEAFAATYPRLATVSERRARLGFSEVDLTAIFDDVMEPVYLDGWHINHRGNEIVADHMLAALVREDLLNEHPQQPCSGMELARLRSQEAPDHGTRYVEGRANTRRAEGPGQALRGRPGHENTLSSAARGRPCAGPAANGGPR